MMRFPAGIQSFEEIRRGGYAYVDKTDLVFKLLDEGKYYFLSRPRRFGKSLLLSTLKSFFEGRRDLFVGLSMERLALEWSEHPVLLFDMGTPKTSDPKKLLRALNDKLLKYEEIYGRRRSEVDPSLRLGGLIERAHARTGRQVVLLVDEYDSPLLNAMGSERELDEIREIMRDFYSPIKGNDDHLRFVCLTGITKFSQLSIFSELNNLTNITMQRDYGTLCGLTEEELRRDLMEGIDALGAANGWDRETTMVRLKKMYDGYHFSWPSADVYNPFGVMSALMKREIGSWWYESGTPRFLTRLIVERGVRPCDIGGFCSVPSVFDAPFEKLGSLTPMLYQSGYLTIVGREGDAYVLDIPNEEVRMGLMGSLLPQYTERSEAAQDLARRIGDRLSEDDLDGALGLVNDVLMSVPYADVRASEGHYQQLLYVVLLLAGCRDLDAEKRTKDGRIDLTFVTERCRYILELKMGSSAVDGVEQALRKDYASRFALEGREVRVVGIEIDVEKRGLREWVVERV